MNSLIPSSRVGRSMFFSELASGNFRVLDRGHYKPFRSLKVPGMIVQDGTISRKRW
jgi:hypothetical protein